MATPLPCLELRYHSKHAVPAEATGAPLNIPISRALPSPLGGLGFSVLDIVDLGILLVTNPAEFFSQVMRRVLGEGLRWLADLAWAPLDDILSMLWSATTTLFPGIRDFIDMLLSTWDAFWWSLIYRLTGQLQHPSRPPRGPFKCACEAPTTAATLLFKKYAELPVYTEISSFIKPALRELMPEIWTYKNDTPTTSIQSFVENSDLLVGVLEAWEHTKPPERPKIDAYDVHDDIAQIPDRHLKSPPYGRAWKWSDSQILVEVGFIRLYSYMISPTPTSRLIPEHEGDGEIMHMLVDVIPVCPHRARLRLERLILSQHGPKSGYDYKAMQTHNGRVVVCVGRGGHALYIGGGPWNPGTEGYQKLVAEYAPKPGDSRAYGKSDLQFLTPDANKKAGEDDAELLYPDVPKGLGFDKVVGKCSMTYRWPFSANARYDLCSNVEKLADKGFRDQATTWTDQVCGTCKRMSREDSSARITLSAETGKEEDGIKYNPKATFSEWKNSISAYNGTLDDQCEADEHHMPQADALLLAKNEHSKCGEEYHPDVPLYDGRGPPLCGPLKTMV
jgi:hypothetical protein